MSTITSTITDLYNNLDARLGTRLRRRYANNTYLVRNDVPGGDPTLIRVLYHSTYIADIAADSIQYRTGGWWTFTTKERINRFLPRGWRLYSERGVWWLSLDGTKVTQFYDGTILTDLDSGIVRVAGLVIAEDPDRAMRREIECYVALYTDERLHELTTRSQSGDCWYCLMFEPQGAVTDDGHLRAHLAEGYVMGSLAYHAVNLAGYKGDIYMTAMAQETHADCYGGTIRRSIRKYLRGRLLHKGYQPLTETELETI